MSDARDLTGEAPHDPSGSDRAYEIRVFEGADLSGEPAGKYRTDFDGTFSGTFGVRDRRALTLWFDAAPSVIELTAIEENGRPFDGAVLISEAPITKERDLICPDGAESLTVTGWGPDTAEIGIKLKTVFLDPSQRDIWRRLAGSLKEEMAKSAALEEENKAAQHRINFAENELDRRTDLIEALGRTRAMTMYRALRKKRGQEDLFERIIPEIPDDENKEIFYNLDSVTYHRYHLSLHGWVYDRLFGRERLTLTSRDGTPVDAEITRRVREDVRLSLGLKETAMPGFEIIVPYEKAVGLPWQLVIEDPRGRLIVPLNVDGSSIRKAAGGDQALLSADYYDDICRARNLTKEEIDRQRQTHFEFNPLISLVIPLYRTPLDYLKVMIDSVVGQSYANWQLCLADGSPDGNIEAYIQENYASDGRILYKRLKENGGISRNTNEAIAMAGGDYVILADHDDQLDPSALFEIVSLLNEHPASDVIYTDEDKMSARGYVYFEPALKPDFSWEALWDSNYICHIFCAKKQLVDKAGGERPDFDGAQDYDFILRVCELAEEIRHIPKVLYHWRAHAASMAGNMDSKSYAYERGRRALQGHLDRTGIKGLAVFGREIGHFGVIKTDESKR